MHPDRRREALLQDLPLDREFGARYNSGTPLDLATERGYDRAFLLYPDGGRLQVEMRKMSPQGNLPHSNWHAFTAPEFRGLIAEVVTKTHAAQYLPYLLNLSLRIPRATTQSIDFRLRYRRFSGFFTSELMRTSYEGNDDLVEPLGWSQASNEQISYSRLLIPQLLDNPEITVVRV